MAFLWTILLERPNEFYFRVPILSGVKEWNVPVPKANQIMLEVVRLLRQWEYTIFVISASNDVSAKVAASMLFDIPVNNIAGIKPRIVNGTDHKSNTEPDSSWRWKSCPIPSFERRLYAYDCCDRQR